MYLPRMTNLTKGISVLHEVVSFILANKIFFEKIAALFWTDLTGSFRLAYLIHSKANYRL